VAGTMLPRVISHGHTLIFALLFAIGVRVSFAAQTLNPVVTSAPDPQPTVTGIHFAAAPEQVLQLAKDRVAQMRANQPGDHVNLSGVHMEPPLATYRTKVSVPTGRGAKINAIPHGDLETDSILTGYLFDLTVEGKVVRSATVVTDASGGLLPGVAVLATPTPHYHDALKRLATVPAVQDGIFEPRLLQYRNAVASGGGYVIWLKSAKPGGDLIFLPQGAPKEPNGGAGILCTVQDFFQHLDSNAAIPGLAIGPAPTFVPAPAAAVTPPTDGSPLGGKGETALAPKS
jgi:hypothetical protein